MKVEHMILGASILNLILLLINLYLLQRGYSQAWRKIQVVVIQQPGTEIVPGGIAAVHLVVAIGKSGTLTHFNGEQEATTLLRLKELQGFVGDLADLYVVPRSYHHKEKRQETRERSEA